MKKGRIQQSKLAVAFLCSNGDKREREFCFVLFVLPFVAKVRGGKRGGQTPAVPPPRSLASAEGQWPNMVGSGIVCAYYTRRARNPIATLRGADADLRQRRHSGADRDRTGRPVNGTLYQPAAIWLKVRSIARAVVDTK